MLIEILPCRAGTPREVAARCWDSIPVASTTNVLAAAGEMRPRSITMSP